MPYFILSLVHFIERTHTHTTPGGEGEHHNKTSRYEKYTMTRLEKEKKIDTPQKGTRFSDPGRNIGNSGDCNGHCGGRMHTLTHAHTRLLTAIQDLDAQHVTKIRAEAARERMGATETHGPRYDRPLSPEALIRYSDRNCVSTEQEIVKRCHTCIPNAEWMAVARLPEER